MTKVPQINFPAIDLNVKVIDGQQFVWDSLRGKYLLLTPEERVRRHAISFLVSPNCARVSPYVAVRPVGSVYIGSALDTVTDTVFSTVL